jgi:hypothetical protein
VLSSLARCCPDAKMKIVRSADGLKDASDHYAAGLRLKTTVPVSVAELPPPVIVVNDRQPREVIAETIRELRLANNPPVLFRRAGELARIRQGDDGKLCIEQADKHVLLARVVEIADIDRATEKGPKPAFPPDFIANSILATADLPAQKTEGDSDTRPIGLALRSLPTADAMTGRRAAAGPLPAAPAPAGGWVGPTCAILGPERPWSVGSCCARKSIAARKFRMRRT